MAAALTQTLIQAVEEPEPLYRVPLNAGQRTELEQRILKLLQQGMGLNEARAVLNLSEREAARILHRIEEVESSDIFRITSLLDERIGRQTSDLTAPCNPAPAAPANANCSSSFRLKWKAALPRSGANPNNCGC